MLRGEDKMFLANDLDGHPQRVIIEGSRPETSHVTEEGHELTAVPVIEFDHPCGMVRSGSTNSDSAMSGISA